VDGQALRRDLEVVIDDLAYDAFPVNGMAGPVDGSICIEVCLDGVRSPTAADVEAVKVLLYLMDIQ